MNRGARRADVFLRDDHCELFCDLVGEVVVRYRVEVHTR